MAGLEEKRQARRHLSRLELIGDLVPPLIAERRVRKADPGRVVDQGSWRHSARPAGASHVVRGVPVHGERSGADASCELAAKRFAVPTLRPQLSELRLGSQDNELRELEPL